MMDATIEAVMLENGIDTPTIDTPIQKPMSLYIPDNPSSDTEVLYEEGDVFANQINIHYGRWFSKRNDVVNAPTALMIHGLTANHRCWGTIAEVLVKSGLNVIATDLRGRGKSDKPAKGYGVVGHAQDTIAFMDEMGLDKPIIIGHSLGAMIGMNIAAHYQDRLTHLIMIDAGAPPELAQLLKIMTVLRPSLVRLSSTFKNPDRYVETIRSAPFITGWNQAIEDHCRYELEQLEDGRWKCNIPLYVMDQEFQSFGGAIDPLVAIANALFDPIGYIMRAWPTRYFPYEKIHVPTLVLRAPAKNREAGDEFLTEDGLLTLKRSIRDCETQSLPGMNHYTIVFAENPHRDKIMLDFLTRD
jgi:pimeloyl-ACP methyl ester carboxylesterase